MGRHETVAKLGHMIRLTLTAAAAVTLAVPAAAGADTYSIVSATHTSSSHKSDVGYSGHSTAGWKLAKPARIGLTGGAGLARVKVRGSYAVDITSSWPGRCAWSATTGDTQYPMVAPGDVQLTVMPDPAAKGKVRVSFLGQHASLGNGYLGTECSTTVSGEPSAMETAVKTVSASAFRKKKVTLTFAGATNREGIAYSWSTKVVLKRKR